jgi:zinc protease
MQLAHRIAATLLFSLALSLPAAAETEDNQDLVPYELFTLDNGLTLIVHEDKKAPIVAVNVWYHVGSKNEPLGKTGFAHLFEHLMFQGSENYQGEYLQTLEQLGASDLNGTTWFDRTNYYETVPKGALDKILFLESDRMGHLLGVIDQPVLDEQRGVVQNEKRQSDNQPYNKVWEFMLEQVFTPEHPYSWETIGSMEDLNAASLDDVREWFKTYYGPNNAVIAIAGDVDTQEVFDKVNIYFGDIPPGPPLTKFSYWVPRHDTDRRQIVQDRVSQPRLYMAWPAPAWGTADAAYLSMATAILGQGKNSRLYKRLVYDEQIATDVALDPTFWEIAGLVYLEVSPKPGVSLATLEIAAREELEKFMKSGPTRKELERIKAEHRSAFLRSLENVGGQPSISAMLAKNMVYTGNPAHYQFTNDIIANADSNDLQAITTEYLGQGAYIAEVEPYPPLVANAESYDRSIVPAVGEFTGVDFPDYEQQVLENGLTLIVANRPAVPVVQMSLQVNAGYAADQFGKPGTAALTMAVLDEGTKRRSALEISEELSLLGAALGTGADLDNVSVSLSALSENLDKSLNIYADIILDPVFPEAEIERIRSQYITTIEQEKTQPTSMALRVLPALVYGDGHAYSQPLTGSGTEESMRAITRADLINYHATWFRPNNSTLIVVGDTTMAEIAPKLNRLFKSWEPGEVPVKNIGEVQPRVESGIYLIDKPGAEQSIIFAARLLPPKAATDDVALVTINDIVGGLSSSRINMNLREDKHWSYGARSLIWPAQAQRPLIIYAPVQTDKTIESVQEIRAELAGVIGDDPATDEELAHTKKTKTLSLPGRWETGAAVLSSLSEMVRFGLPADYWDNYSASINNLSLDEVNGAADVLVVEDEFIWVIVGDRSKIEEKLGTLDMGNIILLDADGQQL